MDGNDVLHFSVSGEWSDERFSITTSSLFPSVLFFCFDVRVLLFFGIYLIRVPIWGDVEANECQEVKERGVMSDAMIERSIRFVFTETMKRDDGCDFVFQRTQASRWNKL